MSVAFGIERYFGENQSRSEWQRLSEDLRSTDHHWLRIRSSREEDPVSQGSNHISPVSHEHGVTTLDALKVRAIFWQIPR